MEGVAKEEEEVGGGEVGSGGAGLLGALDEDTGGECGGVETVPTRSMLFGGELAK